MKTVLNILNILNILIIILVIIILMFMLTACQAKQPTHSTHSTHSTHKSYQSKIVKKTQKTKKTKKSKWPKLPNVQREHITCDYQNKTIEVFLKNGRGVFSACENYQVQRIGYVSAGHPSTHRTPRGDFSVQWKAKEYDSKKYPSKNGGRNMDNAMFFTSNGHAIHKGNINGLSHGCIRTQGHQSKWLYEWSPHNTLISVKSY